MSSGKQAGGAPPPGSVPKYSGQQHVYGSYAPPPYQPVATGAYMTNPSAPTGPPPPYMPNPQPHYGVPYQQTQVSQPYAHYGHHAQYTHAPLATAIPAGPGTTVVVPDAYNAGARFDGIARQAIPPAPPGVVPNAAQVAAMQGNNVVLGQRPNDIFGGGASNSAVFW